MRKVSTTKFKYNIKDYIVQVKESNEPTILTTYGREEVAIVPLSLLNMNSNKKKYTKLKKPTIHNLSDFTYSGPAVNSLKIIQDLRDE